MQGSFKGNLSHYFFLFETVYIFRLLIVYLQQTVSYLINFLLLCISQIASHAKLLVVLVCVIKKYHKLLIVLFAVITGYIN
jgi:hypothetical protein